MADHREVKYIWQVEQKPGGRGREWATLGVGLHLLSWLLSNNRLEKVPFVSVPHTSSNRLLLSNQDKGCTPSVAHSLALSLGPALLNLWIKYRWKHVILIHTSYILRVYCTPARKLACFASFLLHREINLYFLCMVVTNVMIQSQKAWYFFHSGICESLMWNGSSFIFPFSP